MAKKSAPTRPAARKPVASGKQTGVALVRSPRPEGGVVTAQPVKAAPKPSTTAGRINTVTPQTQTAPQADPKPMMVTPAARPRVPEVRATRPAPAPKAEV